ncbi:hypothetical protein QBC38DRAFT_492253 [Podospora fimiseda]|uniref:Uncharacterized protein n=1 Tax=Podospora fimiseda TaxID=252190 RepID=A0AAN6YRX4_9PEZI|nr:hypothetical protein QBC38DRAFT_492253 [Podospora fimiseda]
MHFHQFLSLCLASTVLAIPKHSTQPDSDCVTITSEITSVTTIFPPITTSLAKSCTFTGTQTIYSASGCALTCSTAFCISDAAVTKSCNCPRVPVETVTTTICPTRTPCYQCTTGWGIFTETLSCTTTPTFTPSPRIWP